LKSLISTEQSVAGKAGSSGGASAMGASIFFAALVFVPAGEFPGQKRGAL